MAHWDSKTICLFVLIVIVLLGGLGYGLKE